MFRKGLLAVNTSSVKGYVKEHGLLFFGNCTLYFFILRAVEPYKHV